MGIKIGAPAPDAAADYWIRGAHDSPALPLASPPVRSQGRPRFVTTAPSGSTEPPRYNRYQIVGTRHSPYTEAS
jgi:hypothetical protein